LPSYVRNRHGVYALYRRDKLYYVGLASNLRTRLGHHLKDRHRDSWDRFSVYLTIGDSHLRELESLLLRIVKTKGNKQRGKFAKSEDLRRRFANDAKRSWHLEMQELMGLPALRAKSVQRPAALAIDRTPVLAAYIDEPLKLRARFKRTTLWATVARTGVVRFNGKTYTSPSLAAAAACQRSTCNGWTFWRYERAPGDWVPLDELRK
jgi:RAMA domain-containing protein/GIY-YIG catalytic domain-containing protein